MDKRQKQVKEFMVAAGQDLPATPTVPDPKTRILRIKLLLEEVLELAEALDVEVRLSDQKVNEDVLEYNAGSNVDLVETADAIADISVVNDGAGLACGFDMEPIDKEVHRTNMEKFGLGGHRNEETGKWMKPPNWEPPNIKRELDYQAALHTVLKVSGIKLQEAKENIKAIFNTFKK